MLEKIKTKKPWILLLLTGAVYFFLEYITPLIAPVLIAMLFVTMFGPLLKKMQGKFRIHRQIGAVLLLLIAGAILAGLIWILFSWIVGSMPQWMSGLEEAMEEVTEVVHSVCGSVGRAIGVDSAYLEQTILGCLEEATDYLQYRAVPDMLSQSVEYVKILAAVGGFLVTFLIATVLLAKDYDNIMNRMLDREEFHVLLEVICGIIRYLATFVKAQLVIMGVIALTAALTLGIAGVRHGFLWGILAGLMDALPFVGTGIVLVPLCIVQIIGGAYGRAVVCVILCVVCIFQRELLEPKLIGRRAGISPIAVLLSLYAGIQLFGVWGIIKGPLGFMIIYETYRSILRRSSDNF